VIFIKDRLTFLVKGQCELLSSDPLVYDATDDTTSQITIPLGGVPGTSINDWAVIGDNIWLIKGTSQEETTTKITLEPVWRLFARDHIWHNVTYSSKGAFIASVIENEYINQSDPFYAYPYISVTNADTETTFKAPADEENDIYSLRDYIEDAIKIDEIYFDIYASKDGISITIRPRSANTRTVVFNDGHTLYEGANFGDGAISKVTVLQKVEDSTTQTDFYLNDAGEVVLYPPVPRVEGDWSVISIGEDDIPIDEAQEEFKDTIDSYKIEWASDRELFVGDNVRFRLPDGSTHFGKVTYKATKSSDGLYHYKSGSLKTTLTDKVRSVK